MSSVQQSPEAAARDILVIGASAGGLGPLLELLRGLPATLPATLFVALHTSADAPSHLAALMSSASELPVQLAQDGSRFSPGNVYLARPGEHLLVRDGFLHSSRGPRENRARPSIDALFRSAAASYGSRVVGVLMSGLLDDGVAGLVAIKRCGGVAVVQDPGEAAFPDLPRAALARAPIDHTLSATEIAALLPRLVRERVPPVAIPPDIVAESRIAESIGSRLESETQLGQIVPLGCPVCGGPLWEIDDEVERRYRCHVGHGFSTAALLDEQQSSVEEALWVAMRTLEERLSILDRLTDDSHARGQTRSAELFSERAGETRTQVRLLRRVLAGDEG